MSKLASPDGKHEAVVLIQDDGGGAVGDINRLVGVVSTGSKQYSKGIVLEASDALDYKGTDPLSIKWTDSKTLHINLASGNILEKKTTVGEGDDSIQIFFTSDMPKLVKQKQPKTAK